MTKIYIAGASAELARAKTWIHKARRAGFEVTYDWVASIEGVGQSNPVNSAKQFALASLVGVTEAEVLWWLYPSGAASTGASFEAGYAHACKTTPWRTQRVVVSGDFHKSIFTTLCDHQFMSDMDAFIWLREQYWLPGDPDERGRV